VKEFIFGRKKNDPKGPANEKGEVTVKAPSITEARKAFVDEHGKDDPRQHIVRVDPASVAKDDEPTSPRRRRRS